MAATGMGDDDFDKPIVALANSYTQFAPGHVHSKDMGDLVASVIVEAGGEKLLGDCGKDLVDVAT